MWVNYLRILVYTVINIYIYKVNKLDGGSLMPGVLAVAQDGGFGALVIKFAFFRVSSNMCKELVLNFRQSN